jgi:hypothetical protein
MRWTRKLAVAGSVVGITATALVGVAFVTGGDKAGGADSPDAAITEMAAAISEGDTLAALGFLAPDELSGADAFVERLIPYVSEISKEFDDEIGDVSDPGRFELDVSAVDVEVEPQGEHAAIVSFAIVGEIAIDTDSAPLVDQYLSGARGNGDFTTEFDSRDATDGFDGQAIELVTVELDGSWYISPFLSAGHAWVEGAGLPGGAFELVGEERPGAAADPVAAVDRFLTNDGAGDAAEVAEILGGGEGRFFQVFADAIDSSDLFADSDAGAFDEALNADVEYSLTELEDGRVEIDDIEVSTTDASGGAVTVTLSDGCGSVKFDGFEGDGCFAELFPPGSDVDDTLWVQTVKEDGGYRVVMLPTLFDVMSRFIGPYDAEMIRWMSGLSYSDDPQSATIGEQIDIDFDGRRYVVYEFDLDGAEALTVGIDGDNEYDVFLSESDDGDYFYRASGYDNRFETYGAVTARVVVDSEVVRDCRAFECVPTGNGTTSLTVLEADPLTDEWIDDVGSEDDDWTPDYGEIDPRLAGPLLEAAIVIDGPTSYAIELPAGVYDVSAWLSSGSDVQVTIPGATCDDPSSYPTCSVDHVGGPIEILVEPDRGSTPDTATLSVWASQLTDLVVVDETVVPIAVSDPHFAEFDDVPAGPVVVVATGDSGQDIVLSVSGDASCTDVDHGLTEGEACLVQHVGGSLTVEVAWWSEEDQFGDVNVSLEMGI